MASHEQACTRVASIFGSRWLRHYVSSKLRSDPVFALAYELLADAAEPILDVGCGLGLLAFYLRERGVNQRIIGIDIDERKIWRAVTAAERHQYAALDFIAGDVAQVSNLLAPAMQIENLRHPGSYIADAGLRMPAAESAPPFAGNVVLFDVLHYLPSDAQKKILATLAARVAPGALLLLRDSPRDGSVRFRITYAAEVFAQMISWNWRAPLHFPTAESIHTAFHESEFKRDVVAAWGRTPFNNRLFTFQRAASAVGRAMG